MIDELRYSYGFNVNQIGSNVAYLEVSKNRDDNFLISLREMLIKESSGSHSFGRVVDHENILIPDITIMQNITFYSNFIGIDSADIIQYISNHFPDIRKSFNLKRESFSLVEWCGIGLLIYLAIPQNFYFINMTLHQFSDNKFKHLICATIDQSVGSSIIIYSHPHGIHNIKDFLDNFIVKNNSDISSIINFNEALSIIDT